jgi:hypothetical protein
MNLRPFFLPLCLTAAFAADVPMPDPAKVHVDYNKHIVPILGSKCYSCH